LSEPTLLGTVEHEDDGALRILAPGVGWWSEIPHHGALLGPGSSIGCLYRLNRRFRLVLPDGASGRVTDGLPTHRVIAVEHGQVLFRLAPVCSDGLDEIGVVEQATLGHPAGADLPPGTRAIVSPTDGVFYRKSSPDAPAFVEPGQKVGLGQTVGLVEVMKTFNQILYEGPGFPDQAEVVEVRVEDAAEVRSGQVLVVLR
jgi:acetyl-CoA carboxylase biotin carboxyl carrier protein